MRQEILILLIVMVTILFSCNNEQDKKVEINPLDQMAQVDNMLSEIAEKPQNLVAPSDKKQR